nr:piggyBac transposable element-derived protein 3-like [Vanessa tameamea]
MTVNHFEKIRQFLHFHDNSLQVPSCHPGHDRLHKIRPILESLKKKCQSIPKRETLSVDEQMCATKAANFLRQYFPNKPHKWGYELLVLCDDRGVAYNFEIYSGMENNSALRYANEPDLGASSNIVVRLARTIPRYQQYKLFFDNYYTSAKLISFLSKQGIQSLGSVNKGRLGKDLKIPSLKDLKSTKTERGHSEEWVADVDGTEVGTVMWYDNKPVVLSSSFVGQQPIEKVSR